jgi:putative ABC transport system permease protein
MKHFGERIRNRIFPLGIPLSWLQLIGERKRFAAAIAGVTFAVTLMMYQMGIYVAIFEKVVYPHRAMRGGLVMTSRDYNNLFSNSPFSIRRLEQALSIDGVESIAPVYLNGTNMRNPETLQNMRIFVFGIRPSQNPFNLPEVERNLDLLSTEDDVLFDRKGLKEYGPVERLVNENSRLDTELGGEHMVIRGLFTMGGTISSGGHIIAGEEAFFHIFPQHPRNMITAGMIMLRSNADPDRVKEQLCASLPNDVTVWKHEEFVDEEKSFWNTRSPLAFIFLGTMLVAMIVGAVIVYQILYTDVNDHIHEYATLKAIGAGDRFFLVLILQQAVILMVCGFIPGTLITALLYAFTRSKAAMPAYLSFNIMSIVFLLALAMCSLSGILALRKLRKADPADVF